jgi:hypothetical protein
MSASIRPVPVFGALSVALLPLAALITFLASAAIEGLVGEPSDPVIRAVVLFLTACVVAGLASAPISLVRRERPRWLSIVGLASTLGLIGLFIRLAGD